MYCTKKITDDLIWVGANDRRLAMFEGVYSVPRGVSYNAYLLLDDINALFDTVDKAVGKTFFENLAHEKKKKNLETLEEVWNNYQVYLNDEINFIDEEPMLDNPLWRGDHE